MTITIYRDNIANAVFIEDANGPAFLNQLHASLDDSGTTLSLTDEARGIKVFSGIPYVELVDENGDSWGVSANECCDNLNAVLGGGGDATGTAPAITSALTVDLVQGNTLNYELTADRGVAYEWSNLPAGVTTVEGNVRKLTGGSGLTTATYPVTARAINYFGVDTQTVNIVVGTPAFEDTYSVYMRNDRYMSGNASALGGELGRTGAGAGAADAWSISFWIKPSTRAGKHTVCAYGSTQAQVWVYHDSDNGRMVLRYGTQYNHLLIRGQTSSLTPSAWTHFLITYDGGTTDNGSGGIATSYSRFKIYQNGVEVTYDNGNSNYGYSGQIDTTTWQLGREIGSSVDDMRRAYLNEVAVWGSDQQANVAAIYNSGATHNLSLLGTAPSHWWRMGDGDTFPTISDNIGTAPFTMHNMSAADIVSDVP